MVVWQALHVGEYILRTGRLFADGTPEQVHNGAFRLGHDYQKAAIASDGSRWLVVFEDKTRSTGAVDILGFHLTSDGFHNGTFPISTIGGNEGDPAVAYSGSTFLVVLTDRRFVGDPDVRRIRLNRNAALLDSDGFYIESQTNENDVPAVSPGRSGGWGVAYENGTGPATAITWRHVSK